MGWSFRPSAKEEPMRYMADCRKYPSESNCTLTITGERDEVIRAATEHAVSVHGHENTPQLRDEVAGFIEPEPAAAPA